MSDYDPTRQPNASLELILYRLDELKRTVESGFAHADKRLDGLDERVGHLETWRAAAEVRAEAAEHDAADTGAVSGPDWVKITLGLVALIGAALTIIAQNGG